MDTINSSAPEVPPSLRELETDQKVVGVKQLKKALREGRVKCVYVAENADPQLTASLYSLCGKRQVPLVWVPTMAELGKACGIDVGAAAAALLHPIR